MITKRLRFAVLDRDGFRCHYCGSKESLEVDHVIPKSLGGQDILGNLISACQDCNRGKGAAVLSPDALRSVMKSLRADKREQSKVAVLELTTDSAPMTDKAKKYRRDIGGLMGTGRSLQEAVEYLRERNPSDRPSIQLAELYVLKTKGMQWTS